MTRVDAPQKTPADDAVAEYKRLLAELLEKRPSGTRQRLAAALGKNRSFISQISNPAYATPIPATHIETILEVCHVAGEQRRRFLAAYHRAHPRRPVLVSQLNRHRAHTFYLPDLGNEARNDALHHLVNEFLEQLMGIVGENPSTLPKSKRGRTP